MVVKDRKTDEKQLIGAELIARCYKIGIFNEEDAKKLMKRNIRGAGLQIPNAVEESGVEALNDYAKGMQPKKVFYLLEI